MNRLFPVYSLYNVHRMKIQPQYMYEYIINLES